MKSLFLLAIFIIPFCGIAQTNHPAKTTKSEPKVKQFWFVLLTKGKNRNQDSATVLSINNGHRDNITRLYKEGIIKVAGPFAEEDNWMGIFILDCPTKAEAEKYLQTDPAIVSGRLAYEIRPWYTTPVGSFNSVKHKKQ